MKKIFILIGVFNTLFLLKAQKKRISRFIWMTNNLWN